MDKRGLVVAGEPVRVTGNGRRYFSKAHREAVVAKCLVPGASLAAHIATKFEVTKKTGTAILEELAGLAAKQAKNGFVFPGVGKLVVVNRKARMGRNPQTGEAIKIPAKRVLKFRIAKAMKDAVLK